MTVILATLGINVLLYLFEQTDIVSKYMSEGMVGIIRSIQKIFSGSLKSSSKIIDQSSGTNSYTENHKLNEAVNKPNLQTKNIPDPELLIRTGNTKRLSNFLLWQLAYSEIFFEKKLWPDLKSEDLNKIMKKFSQVKRNFGKI